MQQAKSALQHAEIFGHVQQGRASLGLLCHDRSWWNKAALAECQRLVVLEVQHQDITLGLLEDLTSFSRAMVGMGKCGKKGKRKTPTRTCRNWKQAEQTFWWERRITFFPHPQTCTSVWGKNQQHSGTPSLVAKWVLKILASAMEAKRTSTNAIRPRTSTAAPSVPLIQGEWGQQRTSQTRPLMLGFSWLNWGAVPTLPQASFQHETGNLYSGGRVFHTPDYFDWVQYQFCNPEDLPTFLGLVLKFRLTHHDNV